jgi:hypothetical protein
MCRHSRPIEVPAGLSLWVLTHADLRRTARIRAFTDFVVDALSRERDLLEGAGPSGEVFGLVADRRLTRDSV